MNQPCRALSAGIDGENLPGLVLYTMKKRFVTAAAFPRAGTLVAGYRRLSWQRRAPKTRNAWC